MRGRIRAWAALCLFVTRPGVADAGTPQAVFAEPRLTFGRTLRGSIVEHDVWLQNAGTAPLTIAKAIMTPPLIVTAMPRAIPPGDKGRIHMRLDTGTLSGSFRGQLTLLVNDPVRPEVDLEVECIVLPPVEVSPVPAFFVAGRRGADTAVSLDLINHEPQPLRITRVESASERFTTALETVQPGERYRLTVRLRPDGPVGRATTSLTVSTSSRAQPAVEIPVHTFLHDRVYTFPDAVDLGAIPLSQIQRAPELLDTLEQTLMVYQEGGRDFRATLQSDLPGLRLRWERGRDGDRYQATMSLDPSMVHVGTVQGQLVIETNDPAVPHVTVPIRGTILDR